MNFSISGQQKTSALMPWLKNDVLAAFLSYCWVGTELPNAP
jgi:hypothetical protein